MATSLFDTLCNVAQQALHENGRAEVAESMEGVLKALDTAFNPLARETPHKEAGDQARKKVVQDVLGAIKSATKETAEKAAEEAAGETAGGSADALGAAAEEDARVPTFAAAAAPSEPATAREDADVASGVTFHKEATTLLFDNSGEQKECTLAFANGQEDNINITVTNGDGVSATLVPVANNVIAKEETLFQAVRGLRQLKDWRAELKSNIDSLKAELKCVNKDIDEQTYRVARRASSLERAKGKANKAL